MLNYGQQSNFNKTLIQLQCLFLWQEYKMIYGRPTDREMCQPELECDNDTLDS